MGTKMTDITSFVMPFGYELIDFKDGRFVPVDMCSWIEDYGHHNYYLKKC
jgi:hypothetical protein